jgi:hypothetical protein
LLLAVALGLLVLLRRAFRPVPRLAVDERGILLRDGGWGWIPWDEIEGAYSPTSRADGTLRLRVRVTERLAGVLRARRRPADRAPIGEAVELNLDLAGSDLDALDLLREIVMRSAAPHPSR